MGIIFCGENTPDGDQQQQQNQPGLVPRLGRLALLLGLDRLVHRLVRAFLARSLLYRIRFLQFNKRLQTRTNCTMEQSNWLTERDTNMVLNLLRHQHHDKHIYVLVTVYLIQSLFTEQMERRNLHKMTKLKKKYALTDEQSE